jgi:hypothetical protein
MRVVLASNAVAYDLFTLMQAIDPNIGRACRVLNIQFPASTFEAANAGGTLKAGTPNAAATAISHPDVALTEGGAYNYPQDIKNTIRLAGRSVAASVNNAVAYVDVEFA